MEQRLWVNPNCSECGGTGNAGDRDDQYEPRGVCQACLAWASANGIHIPTEPGPGETR